MLASGFDVEVLQSRHHKYWQGVRFFCVTQPQSEVTQVEMFFGNLWKYESA